MPMRKGAKTAAIGVAAIGAVYCIFKFLKKRRCNGIAQAMVYMQEKNYRAAIQHLSEISPKSLHALRLLSDCHRMLGNIPEAIAYLSIGIKQTGNKKGGLKSLLTRAGSEDGAGVIKLIKARLELYKSSRMDREAFQDAFMLGLFDTDDSHKGEIAECLAKCSLSSARAHIIIGWASNINFADFFETLFFLKDVHDPAVVFIMSAEYRKCFDLVCDGNTQLHRFVNGCFHFVNGDLQRALDILRDEDYLYSRLFVLYITTILRVDWGIEEEQEAETRTCSSAAAIEELADEDDPTVQYYLAKTYELMGVQERMVECVDMSIGLCNAAANRAYKAIILIRRNDADAGRYLEEAMADWPSSLNLSCIGLEFMLHLGELGRAAEILETAERYHADDPRVLIFKYHLGKARGCPNDAYLRRAIREDRRYFKTYINLGNHIMGDPESLDIYRLALANARSFSETFTAFQVLIVVETQNKLMEEYPGLFER